MVLGKQQFFFPFFLFANSRYILLGSLYTSYDLLSPLNGQSYPIKITVWVLGGAGKTLSGAYSLHSERRGSSCLCVAGGRGQAPAPEHPSGRAPLRQNILPSAELQQWVANKRLWTIQPGAGPLNYPSHPPAKKNPLLWKEKVRCCSTKDGIVQKRGKTLNRQPSIWNRLCFKV